MKNDLLMDFSLINNFEKIIEVIFNSGLSKEVIAVENTGDIISLLDHWDKVRELDDPELKKAVFTVIKAMLDSGEVQLEFNYTWVKSARENPPIGEEKVFQFLDEYWDKDDGFGLSTEYLLWFRRKGQSF